jgi:hypothetical protein
VGTPVSLTATVSCPSCSPSTVGAGTIEFFEGGTSLHSATSVNGSGAVSTSVTFNSAGTHNVYAHYAGSGNFGDSDSPVVALSVRVPTTTTVSVTSPAIITQNTTLTANVAGTGGVTVTEGTVQFFDGGAAIGSPANVSGGVATLTRAFSSSGNHTITAQYTGSGDFNDSAISTAATLSVHVNTTTSVTVSGTPVIQGQNTTLNAGVTGGGSTTVTEGTVQFYDGGTAIGTPQTVSAGVATLTASFASSGTHTITAQYIASGVFDGSAVSSGATLTVQLAGTNIAISVTQPGGSGQVRVDVTITPTVYGNYSGTARLVEGGFTLTSGTVAADGTVRLTATMTTGSHTISVAFDGGGNYAASTSAAQPITVT